MLRIAVAVLVLAFGFAVLPQPLTQDATWQQQFAQAEKKQKQDKKNVTTKYKNPMK